MNGYTITKSQAETILIMLLPVTDELLLEARKLETLYNLKLITGHNDDIKAAFFDFAIDKLKSDKDNYLHNEYMLLKEKQHGYNKLTFQEAYTGSQNKINIAIADTIEKYTFNKYSELRLFINNKQIIFETAYREINQFLNGSINGNHGINIFEFINTNVNKRKIILDKYAFNRKEMNPKRMRLIDALFEVKRFITGSGDGIVPMQNNFLLAILHNYIDDDKELSIQKLNNLLTQIDYKD